MTRAVIETDADEVGAGGAGNLTDTAFWEGYWGKFTLPDAVDQTRSFDRNLANALGELLKDAQGPVLEVGCAPGRWLAWIATKLSVPVAGIEFTADGVAATRRNLQMLGVDRADIRHGDFLQLTPTPTYNVVLSLGFVEHFTDVQSVICRHAEWARPGGTVIIGVPNFRGLHGWMQSALDQEILYRHNLEIMDLSRLAALGAACGLVTRSIRYLGSLEPSLPISRSGVRGPQDFVAKVMLRAIRLARRVPLLNGAVDRFNNRFVSSYILASFGKPQ